MNNTSKKPAYYNVMAIIFSVLVGGFAGNALAIEQVAKVIIRPPLDPNNTYHFWSGGGSGVDPSLSSGGGTGGGDGGDQVAANRLTPGCQAEQDAKDGLLSKLNSPDVQSGAALPQVVPPIMTGAQILDPLYNGGIDGPWVKYEYIVIGRIVSGSSTMRTEITIHYMFNTQTRQFAQIKFKNTASQGCVGTRIA
jgi:hypothetical protein